MEKGKEHAAVEAIQQIAGRENIRRGEEAGLFVLSKSGLLLEAQRYMQGSRLILGVLGMILIFAGLMNYLNVMVTGIWSRQKELALLEGMGMTHRQLKRMLMTEGLYYCLLTAGLMLTAGSGILGLVCMYMKARLAYFTFTYPWALFAVMIFVLACICASVPAIVYKRMEKTELTRRLALMY